MRDRVRVAVAKALESLFEEQGLDKTAIPKIVVEIPVDEKFGDYSTNGAMASAKLLKNAPRKIAENLKTKLEGERLFSAVSIAGPGFINFSINEDVWLEEFKKVPDDGAEYGKLPARNDGKVLIEFVSANPTGPLHIGHGRGAVVGDVLARLLKKAGYDITTEYYINDAGLQMENLGRSTLARYKELLGEKIIFPEKGYKGDYIKGIAKSVLDEEGDKFLALSEEEALPYFIKKSAGVILDGIKDDLKNFRVSFDVWTSEKTFHDSGKVEATIKELQKTSAIIEKDDALWLDTSSAGDEKNRVVKRANGVVTYLAADIAYHKDKYKRGFDRLIDVWGADHHGYVARMKAAVTALGKSPDSLEPLLIQLVNLKKGGKIVSMSTRSGQFTELDEVLKEVGVDAARFFFLQRSYDSHLDFDIDLAKEQSSENPVYYVQYAHARICNIFKKAEESGYKEFPPKDVNWSLLKLEPEMRLIKKTLLFPQLVADCAETLQPHPITHYLTDIASLFHKYYYANRVVTDDNELTKARLALLLRLKSTICNGLEILGIDAPEKM